MRSVIARALTARPRRTPGTKQHALEVAAAIEERVGRSYLVAKLVAGELASRAERIGADDTRARVPARRRRSPRSYARS